MSAICNMAVCPARHFEWLAPGSITGQDLAADLRVLFRNVPIFTGKLTSRPVSGRHLRSPASAAFWSTIDRILHAVEPLLRDIH